VKLFFDSSTAFCSSQQGKVTAIVKYLQRYGKASTAYNDLRPFVERLNSDERKQLLEILKSNTVFSDSEKIGDGQYPTKEDVNPHFTLNSYCIESLNQGSPASNFAKCLPVPLLTMLLQLSTAGQITQVVNTYKLRYLVTCALPEHERRQSPIKAQVDFNCTSCSQPCGLTCKPCLENAARKAIQSYRCAMDDGGRISKTLLKTDQHPADDLSILAAMCLIKLSLIDADMGTEPLNRASTTYALQATVLLENAWLHSKHNFQISLMLIRLYKYLGCGNLAMRAYHRLAPKNIQLDTLPYTIFDRLSSLHPHVSSQSTEVSSKQRTPLEHLQEQQKLYKSSRKNITKNSWLSFKHGSYNSIFEMREVSERLTHSISAAMSVIESRKMSRLTEPGTPLTEISNGFDLIRKLPPRQSCI
jgi:N-terminal acetyltransferase B complex non-catalytic subunit